MDDLLSDLEYELINILQLQVTLDNAMNYCLEKRIESDHLHVLSEYICKRLTKFVNNFEQMELKYTSRHVIAESSSDTNHSV